MENHQETKIGVFRSHCRSCYWGDRKGGIEVVKGQPKSLFNSWVISKKKESYISRSSRSKCNTTGSSRSKRITPSWGKDNTEGSDEMPVVDGPSTHEPEGVESEEVDSDDAEQIMDDENLVGKKLPALD